MLLLLLFTLVLSSRPTRPKLSRTARNTKRTDGVVAGTNLEQEVSHHPQLEQVWTR